MYKALYFEKDVTVFDLPFFYIMYSIIITFEIKIFIFFPCILPVNLEVPRFDIQTEKIVPSNISQGYFFASQQFVGFQNPAHPNPL